MKHFFWTKYPFVQVGFAFIGGNALAYTFTDLPEFNLSNNCYLWCLLSIAVFALLLILSLIYYYRQRIKLNGSLFFLLFFALGFIRFLIHDERYSPNHLYAWDADSITAVMGQVHTEPERKQNKIHFVLGAKKIKIKNQWLDCKGQIKLTISDTLSSIHFNDIILVSGHPTKPFAVETPYDFNYARFLAYQNIHFLLFTETQPVLLQRNSYPLSFKYYAIKARQQLESLLSKKIKHQRAYALVTGLLIGKRADFEEEDKQLFTTSGTIHVLAVSGMHVVLIYQSIYFLVSLFRIRQNGIAFNLTVLVLIWFYIFITGLQASASRAAIMITVVLIGKIVQRDQQNTNSLLATAFLMLLYNPYYLADAGFILSFLAVAGILIFSDLSIREHKSKIRTYLFNASLISVSAQVATFPYSIHLFHQFPVYFLLANLVVVPFTTVLLFLSVILLLIYYIPYLNDLLVILIEKSTELLFSFLHFISSLPLPILQHISLSAAEMCLLYGAFLLAVLLFIQRNIKWSLGVALCLTLLSGCIHYRMILAFHRPALLISGKKEKRQYLLSSGHHAWLILSDTSLNATSASDLFLTDHFISDSKKHFVKLHQSFIIQQGAHRWGVWLTALRGNSHENCEALILDYAGKYSYLDPNKNGFKHQQIFFLHGKKSFYRILSPYEMDKD